MIALIPFIPSCLNGDYHDYKGLRILVEGHCKSWVRTTCTRVRWVDRGSWIVVSGPWAVDGGSWMVGGGSSVVDRGSCLFEDKKRYILAPSVFGQNLQFPAHELISPNSFYETLKKEKLSPINYEHFSFWSAKQFR